MLTSSLKYLVILLLSLSVYTAKAQYSFKIFDAKTLEELPYATVQMSNNAKKNFNTTSDESGEVTFPLDFEGEIDLQISYVGYETIFKKIIAGRTKIIYLFPYESELEDVVITASPKESTNKESAYNVVVIDKEDIESRAANNLSEALMNNMNIEIQQGVLGSSITLQGLSGSNVKIMIDGIPVVGRLNGDIDLSQINMSNIERVEIVEGPLSVIYGSNALAGVINLITKKSQSNKIEADVNGYYESVGNYNLDAQVGLKLKNHYIQLNGGRYFFGGWNEKEYDRELSWDPKESYFGDFSYVLRTKSDWFHRFKVSYFQDRILDRKDPTGIFNKADDFWYKTRRVDAAYILNGTYKENYYIQSTNGYNNYSRTKNTYTKDLATLNTTIKENTDLSRFQDTTVIHQVTSRTFIAYNKPESKYDYQIGYDFNLESGQGERFSDANGKNINIADIAAFVSFTYKPTEKLSIQPAIRYGYNSKFTTIPTFSTTLKYDFDKNTILRVSYGMGYRAPTLKEMYLDFQDINHNIQGNENLKAERSHNASVSLEYGNTIKVHKYSLKLNGFFNHKYDGIFLTQIASTDETSFTYVNSYKFQTLGGQLDLSYKVKHFDLNTGLSYIGTYNREKDEEENLKEFFFKPQFKFNVSYDFVKWGLKLSFFNKLVGSSWDYTLGANGKIQAVKLDTYNLMDFTATKSFWKKRIRLSAGIKNLIGVTSINNGLSSGGSHSSDSGSQISTGRTYFVGLKFNY